MILSFFIFLNLLPNLLENTRNEYTERIESLRKAWALVGNDLKTHGTIELCIALQLTVASSLVCLYVLARIPLDDEHCLTAINMDITLEYLIPTLTGAGAITTCLVDYLVRTHNNFIKTCRDIVTKRNKRQLGIRRILSKQYTIWTRIQSFSISTQVSNEFLQMVCT